MVALRSENDRLKNENYTICMRIIDINEENRQLRVTTNTLSNEKDKLMLDLQKVLTMTEKSACNSDLIPRCLVG